jgi:AcrR family transcriptional regulator
MSLARKPKRKPKDAYHHGDLRRALIAAARREVERDQAASVSLKALALGLGVSQPAPYRHFADRETLLMAVAAEGFRDLSSALRAAGGGIDAVANAYVAFGREHTGRRGTSPEASGPRSTAWCCSRRTGFSDRPRSSRTSCARHAMR